MGIGGWSQKEHIIILFFLLELPIYTHERYRSAGRVVPFSFPFGYTVALTIEARIEIRNEMRLQSDKM